jgi:hypothetical protein
MILFRILTKSKEVHVLVFLATEQKPCIFHDKPRHRQFRRQITLQCILIGKTWLESVFEKKTMVKSVIYLLFSYQTGYIM